jgi:hypothetical protein
MQTYKLIKTPDGNLNNVVIRGDGACIPFDPANTDYQAYLKYIEQGGLVLPADAGAGTEEVTPE